MGSGSQKYLFRSLTLQVAGQWGSFLPNLLGIEFLTNPEKYLRYFGSLA